MRELIVKTQRDTPGLAPGMVHVFIRAKEGEWDKYIQVTMREDMFEQVVSDGVSELMSMETDDNRDT